VATNKATCGKTTVEYDERCSYVCNCLPGGGCDWTVTCPDGKGGWIKTSGTGRIDTPPPHPSITVAGNLAALAEALGSIWKRPVKVPAAAGKKSLTRRTFRGTPEQVAKKLGLELG
jgi:hypothetical protein